MPDSTDQPMGYRLLCERHGIVCFPHVVESFMLSQGNRRTEVAPDGRRAEYYVRKYWPGDSDYDHLEFALRYEGLHLGFLRALLPRLDPAETAAYVRTKPTSAYARRIWYLYETFAGVGLDIPDATQGNYVDLADSQICYTRVPERSPRHRVNMNLLGTPAFSPIVRRTKSLAKWESQRLDERSRKVVADIPPELYERALQYLYSRETNSSYAIERETPDQKRAARFVAALREAATRDYLQKDALVSLQRTVVDARFANDGWRDSIGEQNYVGTSLAAGDEQIHFVSPRPEDLGPLMDAFLEASRRILRAELNPVLAAAAIAWPFVFLHPFSDGNGRLHRFLIHYVLAFLRFVPDGAIVPVSACMLRHLRAYNASLETFSKPLLPLIDFTLDARGRLTVQNKTRDYYCHPDCTAIADALFGFVAETIETELPNEILFLRQYDEARRLMREVVDLPNRHADLFVRLCVQNKGTLSKAKRRSEEFAKLTAGELDELEGAVREAFGLTG
ncbi:MAG: Fic family protein [Chthoniobacteraceae bacterium]